MQPDGDPGRIAYIVSRFPKLSETFIVREMEALERLGWEIDLFAFIHLDEPIVQPESHRWLHRRFPQAGFSSLGLCQVWWLLRSPVPLLSIYAQVMRRLWRRPGEFARGLRAIWLGGLWARYAEQRGIRHVHAHWARHPVVAALTISRLTGVSYSFTGHSEDIHRHQVMLEDKVRYASFAVCVSHFLRDNYLAPHVRPVDLEKLQVVRCGLDTGPFRYSDRSARPPVILAVARLDEVKGLTYLVEACRLLHRSQVDFECRIIGDGPLWTALETQIIEGGLQDRVKLLGARKQEEVREHLSTSSVFVLPSIVTANRNFEGVPVSIMEAMASGVPVVSTQTGAIPEIVRPEVTGLLVPPGDPQSLADAIKRFLDDPVLAEATATRAREYLEAEFGIDGNARRLHELIIDAVAPSTELRVMEPRTVSAAQ